MSWVKLENFAVSKGGSVDPAKYSNEVFDLYSIPSYDQYKPDVVAGSEIGSSKKIVQPGDVLLSRIVPHIRRVWVVGPNQGRSQIGSGEWLIFRGDSFEPNYLRHMLMADPFHQQFMKTVAGVGGSLLRARPSEVEKIKIPLPPLPEQKRIAAILDKADSIRRKRQEAVRITEELLRSVFLDMFGDPVTNPKGWDVVEFGELCEELRYGTSNMCSKDRKNGDLPVLRIPNVIGGLVNWNDMKHVQLPDAENNRLRLVQGDILFVRTNGNPEYIGRCAVYEDTRPALYASYLIRARLKKDSPCLSQYASSCFTFPTYRKRLVAEAKTTAGNFNINTQGLKGLKLPIPPINLQKKFRTLRNKLATSIVLLQSGFDVSDTFFNSLLLRAFKGKL